MVNYTNEELKDALKVVNSTIKNCAKMLKKFSEGSSQHSLLRNRVKALTISESLIEKELCKQNQNDSDNKVVEGAKEDGRFQFSKNDIVEAFPPIVSIIGKCEKAKGKFEKGSTHSIRFEKLIKSMEICKSLIERELTIIG